MIRMFMPCILALCVTAMANGQNAKPYVLTYKLRQNEVYRISMNVYYSVSSNPGDKRTYGEMAFDLAQTVESADADFADIAIRARLNRCVLGGKNLTYKLANLYAGRVFRFSCDRFGKLYNDSIFVGKEESAELAGFRSDMSYILPPLPNYPVKIGDGWDVNDFLSDDQVRQMVGHTRLSFDNPQLKGRYTLFSVTDNVAKLVADMEIKGSGKMGAGATVDILLQVSAEYYLDLSSGMLTNGKVDAQLAGIAAVDKKDVNFRASRVLNFVVEKGKQ